MLVRAGPASLNATLGTHASRSQRLVDYESESSDEEVTGQPANRSTDISCNKRHALVRAEDQGQEPAGMSAKSPVASKHSSRKGRKRKIGAPKGETIRYRRDPPPTIENTEKGH